MSELRKPFKKKDQKIRKNKNIAGRLPKNSRNRFVDRQSKQTVKETVKNSKTVKKTVKGQTKKLVFSLKADLLYFD